MYVSSLVFEHIVIAKIYRTIYSIQDVMIFLKILLFLITIDTIIQDKYYIVKYVTCGKYNDVDVIYNEIPF